MESQAKFLGVSAAGYGEEPNKRPFRLYFGLGYIFAGITLLIYTLR